MVRIRRIKTLMSDMGVNLAGVEVALRLMAQLQEMEELVNHLNAELQRQGAPADPDGGAEEVVS